MKSERPSQETVVELRRTTLNYGSGDVVRNVDLKLSRGETKVVLGPSGVGKSTILKGILGLIRPKAGEIFVDEENISELRERDLIRIRIKIAMVFQHGALFDSMTVGDNVSFRLREHALLGVEKIDERVSEVLRFVGMQSAKKLKPAQLSGGMKKRVAIARALASDPEIFLFDEPTVGLDPVNLYNVEELILKLKREKKATMMIVTHDVESAMKLADTIVMLHEGKFIFEGTSSELKASRDERVLAFLDPSRVKQDFN